MRSAILPCKMEKADRRLKLLGLLGELFGRGGHLFRGGTVLLNHLIQLLNGFIDLIRARVLFIAGGADLLHQLSRALHVGHNAGQHLAGGFGHFDAGRR